MREIGIGVIGMGWMGEAHSRAYRSMRDRFDDQLNQLGFKPKLICCSDTLKERVQAQQLRFGFEKHTTEWRRLIEDPKVEVVHITTPNGMHLEMIEATLKAGKHVFCEKPVGKNPSESLRAWELSKDARVITGVGYNYRWAPMVQHAQKIIAEGKLGRLTHYHGRFLNGYAGNPNTFFSWRFQEEHGLGTLSDLMSHVIDMGLMLAGEITQVSSDKEIFIKKRPLAQEGVSHYASASSQDSLQGEVTNEDYVNALVHFKNGARGILESCRVINGAKCDMSFEIHGTQGAIKWNMEDMNQLHLQWRDLENPAEEGYRKLLSSPSHPFHKHFNPAPGLNLGYDDLKTIEAFQFLKGVFHQNQGKPGFLEVREVALVQEAMMRSWKSQSWEKV